MKLRLTHSYPFPYPMDATEEQQEELTSLACRSVLELDGVVAYEQVHTLTVEFDSYEAMQAAQEATGWALWGSCGYVLEAKVSSADGYEHPAIIADNKAWCGYQLRAD